MPIEKRDKVWNTIQVSLISTHTIWYQSFSDFSCFFFFSDGGLWSRGIASGCLLRARLRSCMLPAPCLRTFRGLSDTQPALSVKLFWLWVRVWRAQTVCMSLFFPYHMMKGRLLDIFTPDVLILPRLFKYININHGYVLGLISIV